ncbi:MAG: hypothetical protein ACXVCM_03880 [Ktedonobacteraceae bacterium]
MPYLPELVSVLERCGELCLDAQTRKGLLALSPATADRLLRTKRERHRPNGLSTTKPGTLLKHAIPVRTFADWDDAVPGFVEVDLVAHCGESTHGEYLIPISVLRDHSKMGEVGQRTETLRVGFQLVETITHPVNHLIK